MYIVKRDGTEQRFDAVKIKNALAAAFGSVGHDAGEDVLDRLTAVVVSKIPSFPVTVEQVQDLAEKTLMEEGYFDEVKSFILYRDARAKARAYRNEIASRFDDPVLVGVLKGIQYDYPEPEYDLMHLSGKFARSRGRCGRKCKIRVFGARRGGTHHAGSPQVGVHCRAACDVRYVQEARRRAQSA